MRSNNNYYQTLNIYKHRYQWNHSPNNSISENWITEVVKNQTWNTEYILEINNNIEYRNHKIKSGTSSNSMKSRNVYIWCSISIRSSILNGIIRGKTWDTHKYQSNYINLIRTLIKILRKEYKSHVNQLSSIPSTTSSVYPSSKSSIYSSPNI